MTDSATPVAPAGCRRFWIAVLCFAIANAAVWVGYHQIYGSGGRRLLRVERFSPGDETLVAGRPTLVWQFNLDVAPNRPGESPGTVSPAVAGKWVWRDGRTLAFTPDDDLPRATKVSFTLSPDKLRTAEGFMLAKAYAASILTSPLHVLGIRQASIDDNDRYILELEFSDRVLPADVAAHLSLEGPDQKNLGFKLHGDAVGSIVRVITDSVPRATSPAARAIPRRASDEDESTAIVVRLRPGLAGLSGPLGLARTVEQKLTLEKVLAGVDLHAASPAEGKPYLRLRFNGELTAETIKQVLSVEPAVSYTMSYDSSAVTLRGDFAPGMRYAVKIAPRPNGADRRKFPRPDTFSALVPDKSPGVWFEHDEGYLSAAGNRTLLAHAVNIPEVKITIWRVYDNNLVSWRNSPRYRWSDPTPYSQPLASTKVSLGREKNKQQYIRLELDKLLPPGASGDGVYRVELETAQDVSRSRYSEDSDDSDYEYGSRGSNSAVVTLSDIGLTAKQTRTGVVVWAVSLRKAAPLANVRIRLFSSKNQLLGEALTNGEGLANLDEVHPADGERPSVILADVVPQVLAPMAVSSAATRPATAPAEGALADIDEEGIVTGAATRPSSMPAGIPPVGALAALDGAVAPRGLTWLDLRSSAWNFADSDLNGRPYLRQGHEAFVYTDRGVYRPGETVHLRAVVRAADFSTPSPFPVRWLIRRPDLRDWRGETVMLDADGAAGWKLELPADLPTGRWTAYLGLPGEGGRGSEGGRAPSRAGDFFGQVAFQVEEFMPDRMKVALTFAGTGLPDESKHASTGDSEPRFAIGAKPLTAHVQADYLFGRPAAGLPAVFSARIQPAGLHPAKWSGWTFGDSARLIDLPGTSPVGSLGGRAKKAKDDADEQSENAVLNEQGHGKWEMDLGSLLELDAATTADNEAAGDPKSQVPILKSQISNPKSPTSQPSRHLGPWTLSVAASVSEAGGRAVSTSRIIDVDALPWYIGLRKARPTAAQPNEATQFEVALIKPSGEVAPATATLELTLYRETWNTSLLYRDGRYHYQSTRVLEVVKSSTDKAKVTGGRATFALTLKDNGAYILRAYDRRTNAMTSLSFYASDGTPWEDNISRENPERLQIALLPMTDEASATTRPTTGPATLPTASAKDADVRFRPGDRARVLVRSPFAGRLLLTVETDQVLSTQIIDMPASQVTVPIDITEACRPNAYVTATVIRAINPDAKWRTHRAFGATRLVLDPAERKLDMRIIASTDVRPKSALPVKVQIIDARGTPVRNAAVTLAAVDEGILQLTNFATPNPLSFFSAKRALGVKSADLYSLLMPEVPKPDSTSAVGGDKDDGAARHGSPVVAKRVKSVALVSEVLHTDDDGMAATQFAVPEFAGKLRVMAVSYAGHSFGSTDQGVLVRSPIILQSSFPRFAAPGDRFTVPMILFNNSSLAGQAKVSVEIADGGLRIAESGKDYKEGRKEGEEGGSWDAEVNVPAGGRQPLKVNLIVGNAAGVAHVRLVARMNDEMFEENLELPIRPASPLITRGGYAIASPDAPAKLPLPGGMLAGTETFELKVTQWPTLELPAGLGYLERYPYGCAEQTTSACFPLAYLSDIGRQIALGVFEPTRVSEKVQVGIYRLIAMQTSDGGLAMWPGSRESWSWASVYAGHFIVEAEKAGHSVPEDFRRQLLGYVRRLLDRPGDNGDLLEAQAYACYVLALAGRPERAAMSRLSDLVNATGASALPQYGYQRSSARLYLAAAWMASGRRDLAMGLIPQTPPVPRPSRQLGGNIGSPIRDRALLISTLLDVQGDHPGLPAMVQQLADTGRSRQWNSTQDTAFAVMAIGKYLRQSKPQTPYESAEVTAGGEMLATSAGGKAIAWTAGNVAASPTTAPATRPAALPTAGGELVVRVAGPAGAKAYVTWLQNGVPLAPPADADNGLKIRRRYTDEKGAELPKSIRSGDLVRVEITIEAQTPLDNVVIEDLLPATLEIENARLETSAATHRRELTRQMDGARPAFAESRLDIRDDRLILMGNLSAGIAKYVYLARAVAPGTFIVPPVKAECMYDIGINSVSSGGGTIVVTPVQVR